MTGRLLATDLDRTLLPNGDAEESLGVRSLLADFVAARGLTVAYVTGRRLELVEAAIAEYGLPRPDWVVADVGTSLYRPRGSEWEISRAWSARLASEWSGRQSSDLAPLFADEPALALQEPAAQRPFKLSFHAPMDVDAPALLGRMRARLADAGVRASVVHSVDEGARRGLVDVLPGRSTKLGALEFLMADRGLTADEVVFAGDSGNDLEVFRSPIPAVLVANADPALRARAVQEVSALGLDSTLFVARGGYLGLNGNYAAGILEGWVHYHPEDHEVLAGLVAAGPGGAP